jgi:haloacetate dehalogenase
MLDTWSDAPDAIPAEIRAEYVAKFSAPDTIHAVCEEYRAGATLDYQHDEADRGRRRITCPTLALWSHTGHVASRHDPLEVWQSWADDGRGGPICAGHLIPEKAPRRDIPSPRRVPRVVTECASPARPGTPSEPARGQ